MTAEHDDDVAVLAFQLPTDGTDEAGQPCLTSAVDSELEEV